MANSCKHTKCVICGGYKLKSNFLGRIGTKLNEVCSPKCQVATKDICSCKCGGKFHKGANSSLLNKILNPKPAKKAAKKKKSYKANFEPMTLTDNIAEFLEGTRIKTSSFDKYSDRNYRKDNRKITLNWLSKTGRPLDQLAYDFLSEKGYLNYDEDDIIYAMVNYINDYPSGIKKYIEDIEAERIRENDYYNYLAPIEENMQPETIEDNYIRDEQGNIIFGNMKLKKGSSAAKAYMAKLRAKRKIGAATKVKAKKPKSTNEMHTDTKSHNVNIRVISGFLNKMNGLFDTAAINDIDQLKKEYFKLAKKYHPDAGGTDAQFQQLQLEYEKHLKSLLNGSKLSNEQKENELQLDEALRNAANALAGFENITIELAGKWLWVTGNTYPIRTQLRSAGFLFAPNKKAWFFKGAESSGRGSFSMEEIKTKYGATKIMPTSTKKIEGIGSISTIKKKKFMLAMKKATKALNKRII